MTAERPDNDRLANQLEQRDRELRLIASDIHDGLLHYFIAAKMANEAYRVQLQRRGEAVPKELEQVSTFLKAGIDAGRQLMDQLWPVDLETLSLAEALADLAQRYHVESAIPIQLDVNAAVALDDTFQQRMLYRIAHGALTNIVRHSKATKAAVRFSVGPKGDGVIMQIEDNGHGFDPASIGSDHFGLRSMRERASIIGGRLVIRSDAQGTVVRVEVPSDATS